jgi:hypothetical protein
MVGNALSVPGAAFRARFGSRLVDMSCPALLSLIFLSLSPVAVWDALAFRSEFIEGERPTLVVFTFVLAMLKGALNRIPAIESGAAR